PLHHGFFLLLVPSLAAHAPSSVGPAQNPSFRILAQRHHRQSPSLAGGTAARVRAVAADRTFVPAEARADRVALVRFPAVGLFHPHESAAVDGSADTGVLRAAAASHSPLEPA